MKRDKDELMLIGWWAKWIITILRERDDQAYKWDRERESEHNLLQISTINGSWWVSHAMGSLRQALSSLMAECMYWSLINVYIFWPQVQWRRSRTLYHRTLYFLTITYFSCLLIIKSCRHKYPIQIVVSEMVYVCARISVDLFAVSIRWETESHKSDNRFEWCNNLLITRITNIPYIVYVFLSSFSNTYTYYAKKKSLMKKLLFTLMWISPIFYNMFENFMFHRKRKQNVKLGVFQLFNDQLVQLSNRTVLISSNTVRKSKNSVLESVHLKALGLYFTRAGLVVTDWFVLTS